MNYKNRPILLMILDGFGIRKEKEYNGILTSHMDFYFNLWDQYPHLKLNASGPGVGLPDGQIGSSEVGHLTIGAGRIIKQPLVRINEDFQSGKIKENIVFKKGIDYQRNKKNSSIHLLGLLSPGGVHSHMNHLFKILEIYDDELDFNNGEIYIHCFGDGRDVAQKSILNYLKELDEKIKSLKNRNKIHIASICGRYYSMDRDRRIERTKKAFDLLTRGIGIEEDNYNKAIKNQYKKNITDEFLLPIILKDNFKPITDNDLVFWYNFRADRPRQLTEELLKNKKLKIHTLTQYNPDFNVEVLYPTIYPKNTIGEIISKKGLKQLRIAESEKFPHVTYFLNGLRHEPFKNEVDIKISSPKVATYDLKPEMSSKEVTRRLCKEIKKREFDFIVLNFANSDMVGHTGNLKAVQIAMKEIDLHIKEIKETLDLVNGVLIITADHGNCETMVDEKGNPHTKHTYNKVPFILCSKEIELKKDNCNFSLANIAPTILELLGIKEGDKMVESLIEKKNEENKN